MKKILVTLAVLVATIGTQAQSELSKAEKQRLKEELKSYMSDLAAYKAKMLDIRTTLDSNEVEIARLKDDLAYADTRQAELEFKVAAYDTELKKAQQENTMLKGGTVENPDPEVAKKVVTQMNKTPEKGTIYKVQIGLYEEFNINKYFEQPRYIGYEEVDGMNRYIISFFPDEETAKKFVVDVRKMGVKDAFVSKYIDGQRVYEWSKNPKYAGKPVPASLQEHLENEKKEKARNKKQTAEGN